MGLAQVSSAALEFQPAQPDKGPSYGGHGLRVKCQGPPVNTPGVKINVGSVFKKKLVPLQFQRGWKEKVNWDFIKFEDYLTK